MRFFKHKPMWAPGPRPHRFQVEKQFGKKVGALKQRNPEEIHVNICIWVFKDAENFVDTWNPSLIADSHQALKRNVIPFGIHNADLIRLRNQTFNETSSERRFSAPRRSSNKNIGSIGRDPDDCLIEAYTEGNVATFELLVNLLKVVGDEVVDQLDNPVASGRSSNKSGRFLDRIERICHCHGTFGELKD